MGQYTAVVDIGSSKVICLICGSDNREGLSVKGAGLCEYDGLRHGTVTNPKQLSQAITDAVTMAENEAGLRMRRVSVGVPGPMLKLELQNGSTPVTSRNKRVGQAELNRLMEDSLNFQHPEGYELIHSTPLEFSLKETPLPGAPEGVTQLVASARVSHVFVQTGFKELVGAALDKLELEADMYIGVSLAESLFVVPEKEQKDRALLIDVGARHTEISLLQNSALADLKIVEIGGGHFASDLAYGLNIPQVTAENVKRKYVYSLHCQDSLEVVRLPDGSALRVEHEAIRYIIEARSEELIRYICGAMLDMGLDETSRLPIYLTGGGIALMRGSCEYIERCMGMSIQVRMPWMPRLSSPNYASAFAVMNFVMTEAETVTQQDEENKGFFGRIKDFFLK